MEARRDCVSSFAEKDTENTREINQRNRIERGNVYVVVPIMETKSAAFQKYFQQKNKIKSDTDYSTNSVTSKTLDNDDDKENTEEKRLLSRFKILSGDLEPDKIFSQQQTWTSVDRLPMCKGADIQTLSRINDGGLQNTEMARVKHKIRRPANAFMLFANKWRKELARENPRESNKDISVRLGKVWKNLPKEEKEEYFALAREVDKEHKRKYPGNVTSLASHTTLFTKI